MATHAARERETTGTMEHTALPRWVMAVQDHALLTCLILAEAYLLGTLMTLGWVPDIEAPGHWGIFHGIGVALFFAAGATAAGVALRCSVTAAVAFTRHAWGRALFNMLGLLVFSVAEIWASLSERSAHLTPTPADTAVLNLLGLRGVPVSPTVLIVALLLPFASLYWGFAQQPKPVIESADELETRQAREMAEARHKAAIRAVKVAGLHQAKEAAFGRITPLQSDAAITPLSDADTTGIADADTPVFSALDTTGNEGAGTQAASGAARKGNRVPAGMMTSPQFRRYLAENGVGISPEKAVAIVQSVRGCERIGTTFAAGKAPLMRIANNLIQAAQSTGNEEREQSA